MLSVLTITGPIYLVIAVGFLATRLGLFQRTEMRTFGKYVINLALPPLLFNALSQRSVAEVIEPVFVAAYAGGSLLAMAAGIFWARRVAGKPLSEAAMAGLGMACPNSGFIGFPVVAQVFGLATAGVGLALAMVVENFITLPLAIALAEAGAAGDDGRTRGQRLWAAVRQSLRGLVRNPMIHGVVWGFVFSLLGWSLPEPVAKTANLLAASCAAISLLVIGGSLVGIRARGMLRDVGVIAAGKLLLHPLAVLLMVVLLPPMDTRLQTVVVLMAAVPMLGIYPIIAQRHGHDTMAAAAQLGTTIASFFTLSSLVWLLQQQPH